MKSPTRLAIEAALAGIDTAKSGGADDRVKAREHYEFVAMDCDMRQLLQEHDARVKVLEDALGFARKALDDIYNHNAAARAAVVFHYGICHTKLDVALNQSPKE